MIGALACYLAFDLHLERKQYRSQRGQRGRQWYRFFRWWVTRSKAKLSVSGGIILIVTFAFFMSDYGMAIPEFCNRLELSTTAQWGLFVVFTFLLFIFIDVFKARKNYTAQRGVDAGWFRFYRRWLSKRSRKFAIAGGIGIIVLAGAYFVQRDDVMPLKGESKVYIAKARRYHKLKKYNESIEQLRRVIQVNPDDEEAHLQMARSLWSLGSKQEALNAYKTVVKLNPRSYFAHAEMAQLAYNGLKNADLGLSSAMKAAELSPEKPKPHMIMALIYSRTGRVNQAVDQYKIVLKTSPDNEEARVKLIELYLARQLWDDAAKEADRSPHGTVFTVLHARADAGKGKEKEALAALSTVAANDPASPLPLVAKGDILARRGEYPQATKCYDDALNRSPENIFAMSSLALLLADHSGDLARSEELATKAYHKSWPKDPTVTGVFGWVKFKQGKLQQALPLLQEAATGISTNPLHRYHYGVALLQAGQRKDGRRELEEALKISQNFDGAALAAGLLRQGNNNLTTTRKPSA